MDSPQQAAYERVRAVKVAYVQQLLAIPDVVGVGVGYRQVKGVRTGELALIVMVRQKKPASQVPPEHIIPHELEGVPVDVQEVGEIGAQ
jgi:hypothetical protein